MQISRSHTFTPGSVIQSSQINEELNQQVDAINGLDDRVEKIETNQLLKIDSSWKTLTPTSGWYNAGGFDEPLRVMKSPGGICLLSGVILGGNTAVYAVLATLPKDYRPAYIKYIQAQSSQGLYDVILRPNGELANLGTCPGNAWVRIHYVYRAEQ